MFEPIAAPDSEVKNPIEFRADIQLEIVHGAVKAVSAMIGRGLIIVDMPGGPANAQ